MTHALKIWPEFVKDIESETKTFELRKDDRPFTVEDTLLLQEWNPKDERYTGKELLFKITYILRDVPKFGLKAGYVILGIKPKEI